MAKTTKSRKQKAKVLRLGETITIGRKGFEKISAVEGIRFTAAMKERALKAKHDKLSPEEYRATIVRAYGKA